MDSIGKVALMEQLYPWVRVQETPLRSTYGTFRLRAYEFPDGREHSALIAGDPHTAHTPLVRAQSACLTGTAFGALLCDCRQQLEMSLRQVKSSPHGGVVLYLDQEGRGHGLVEKARQLSLIADGSATTANASGEGLAPDVRDYESAFAILDDILGQRAAIWLLTNNPTKLNAFTGAGYEVLRMPLESVPTDDNRGYLLVKKQEMGHLLTSV